MYRNILRGRYSKRILIILTSILWCVAAIRLVSKDITAAATGSGKDMVSVFCDNVYTDVSSEITAYGVLTESYLSASAKRLLLEDMAQLMGLNAYSITRGEGVEDTGDISVSREDGTQYGNDDTYSLVQNSIYGDVTIRIIYNQDKYYLSIDLRLDKGIESTLQYREIIENICSQYGIDGSVNVCLKGAVDGDIGIEKRKEISSNLLRRLKAKEIQSKKTMDMFVVYAKNNSEKNYISLGKKKVNINIAMEYDENNNKTWIYLATPVYIEK